MGPEIGSSDLKRNSELKGHGDSRTRTLRYCLSLNNRDGQFVILRSVCWCPVWFCWLVEAKYQRLTWNVAGVMIGPGGIMAGTCNKHDGHTHTHGPNCGHIAVRHEGHTDYLHDGHMHHIHGDHVDDHRISAGKSNP